MVGAQTMQEIVQRLDVAYQRFFKKLAKRPPKFKSAKYFKSFVLKDAGYNLNSNSLFFAYKKDGKRAIKRLRYINSRGLNYFYKNNKERNIFNVRIKKDLHNRYWVIFTVKQPKQTFKTRKTRGAIGIDFGLKTYMITWDGKKFFTKENPQFLKADLERLRIRSKAHSRKKKGSNNRKRAKTELSKVYQGVSNKRSDWQWKLAHELCKDFKFIGLEDLNPD